MRDNDQSKLPAPGPHDVAVDNYQGIGVGEPPRLRDPKRNRKSKMPGGNAIATISPGASDEFFGID